MAVYKVIQDIESQDKLFGPLTLKGFIYLAIAGILVFIDVRLAIGGVPSLIKIIFITVTVPPVALLATLASPLGREQPTEVWLLSRIRFLFKPRLRKWDQSGMKEMVIITAPKKISKVLTKGFSQSFVTSRLQALANTLDSRGWAIKNVAINDTPSQLVHTDSDDDRLAEATTLEQAAPVLDVHPSDDMLDESSNPTARNMASMMEQAELNRRKQVSSIFQPGASAGGVSNYGINDPTPDELALLDKLHNRESEIENEVKNQPDLIRGEASAQPVSNSDQTVKMELANSGNDLSVATIASLANHSKRGSTS